MRPEVYNVMFAFATTTCSKKTNDYVIMLKNHERALHVNAVGKVTATDISLAQFFTMESVGDILDDTFKIALYVKEVGRYLCFRRGKLVGMKHLSPDCHFIESLDHGYFLYANAYNPLWRVGFTRGFKPVGPRHLQRPQAMRKASFLFVKINAEHFDRDMFTTTAPPSTSTTTTIAPFNSKSYNRGHRNREATMTSSITEDLEEEDASQEQQRKRRKRPHHQNPEEVEESTNGVEKRRKGDHNNARKRKHHQRLAAAGNTAASPQPKNLVRQQSGHKGLENRRRKFQREEHARKMRLQNQRRRKQIESHQNLPPPPFASSSSSSSASASVSATSLAATASLAPSALNIVAMLAAGRRKKGRRKKQTENGSSQTQAASSHDGHEAAMDLQLVAQHTSPVAGNLYDLATEEVIESSSSGQNHEHNYYEQHRQFQPVTSSMPAPPENNVQPQNHKYSNSRKDRRNLSNSHKHSSSSSPNHSHSRSHSYRSSRNYKHSHSYSPSDSHSNLNENTNVNVNNAIPALPKNFNMSKDSNHNNQYFTTTMTDFNTRKRMLPNHSQTSTPAPQPQHLPLHLTLRNPPSPSPLHQYHNNHQRQSAAASDTLRRSRRDLSLIQSLTSQHQRRHYYRNPSTTLTRPNFSKARENTKANDKEAEKENDKPNIIGDNHNNIGVSVATYSNNEGNAIVGNSNRLLGNSNHIRNDNNFQHQEQQQRHLVNRLKLIYLNRISNENSRSNSNTEQSNKNILNNSNNNKQASIPSSSRSNSKSSNSINDNKSTIEVTTRLLRSQLLSLNLKQNLKNVMANDEEEDTATVNNNIISYTNPKVIRNDLKDNNIFLKHNDIREAGKDEIKSLYAAFHKLFFLGQNVNRQQQQPLQVNDNNKLINNNNNNVPYSTYDHDDVNRHDDNGNDDDDDGDENANDDELIRNENKYEKIIVQYRSVVYLFEKERKDDLNLFQTGKYSFGCSNKLTNCT